MSKIIVIRGSGDIASGVAHRLKRCGFDIIMTDIEKPTFIRRAVSFGEAIYEGSMVIEGVRSVRADSIDDAGQVLRNGDIAVIVDENLDIIRYITPHVLVDAILAKRNMGTKKTMAQIVIGLGPGFRAGDHVDIVIETNRGHNLGRVIEKGCAEGNTGVPGSICGYTVERLIKAPAEGVIRHCKDIGDFVKKGEVIGFCGDKPVGAPIDGVIRGFIKEGIYVSKGFKIGDIDPRGIKEYCFSISDKARAIGGGVLEAILMKNSGV